MVVFLLRLLYSGIFEALTSVAQSAVSFCLNMSAVYVLRAVVIPFDVE